MHNLRRFLRDYMYFNNLEIRGFYALSLIMLACLFFYVLKEQYFARKIPFSVSESDKKILDSLLVMSEMKKKGANVSFIKKNSNFEKQSVKKELERFAFDPNTVSEADWLKLGVKPFLAKRIINYTAKKGVFRNKKDLLKIYGFPPELYAELEPYVQLPDATEQSKKSSHDAEQSEKKFESRPETKPENKKKIEFIRVNLNTADSAELCIVKGIGPAFASRIVKYREKIGGFVVLSQIREVFGITDEVAQKISPQLFVETDFSPRKIAVNQADKKMLGAHPYIGYKNAETVLLYIKNNGKLKSEEDFKKIGIWSDAEIERILPYISFR